MNIEWNKVTRYSQAIAIILFVGTFFLGFWLGTIQIEPINTDVTSSSFSEGIQSTSTIMNKVQIRNVVWKQYFDERFSSSVYAADCGAEEQHIFSVDKVKYADLNYDGEEDAVVKYFACWNGTGGGQSEVLTLTSGGTPIELFVSNGVPEGEEKLFEGAGGHGYYTINEDGKLQFDFPIYKEGDPNCCPSGGTKVIVYEWNKASQQFEVSRASVLQPETSQDSEEELQPTTGLETNEYVVGQYLDWVGKVSEYVQDCGGGENCLSYLRISLPENMIMGSIFEARINIENCVDKTLRGGETVQAMGRIQNVVPDIGLILSCADTKTSVTKKEDRVAKELDVTSQPAYLVGMYMSEGKYYAELDYVEWLHGEEQLQAMIEDGQCPSSGADCYVYPNGYKRNKNPLIHSVPLASDVAIELSGTIAILSGGYSDSSVTRMTLAKFAQVIQSEISTANRQTNEFRNPITFVKVDIKDGSITRIVEPYQE